MNELNAVITSIVTEDNISLVMVEAAGISFTTLVIDTPATASYLHSKKEVIMVFKETAMSIAKSFTGGLSIRNRFPSIVTAVNSGKVLTAILLILLEINLKLLLLHVRQMI